MTEQQGQNLLLKVDPLSTIRNNKFITQGEKFSGNRDSEGESFVSNISSPPLKRRYKSIGFRIFCNTRRWTACVRQKFESVYLHEIKKHRNNLLFSYYELGFRCFELNLFSHCFDSVRFEKFKPEQALRTLDWKDSLFTRNSLETLDLT